ncbi:MAG: hypothetical protein E5V92_23095 [Mesorhizobium sp.]|uniref:hypothetical protein n=1 Tax=unclassified Mesorhizobium TaxID=325217 RepID=UPI000F75D4A8|nr:MULTISPECIES: hypothetical protein [unclassified Mesorhizobium]AZO73715.1 hypothetical protein EJ067_23265 [Mesorhizobium sp. M1D.F.Ca.ET.043.01.1.1]RWA95522.1 MAG: hypothetical protein EOQ32_07365 [Mesorhizobium sp.]RWE12491.1 MAG: hypothetical protein EOS61_14795 [Mesorhizobium sp.]TJW82058.1 MAG: hypothetical protein E5V92_23095 [Mesorhizobium sp.]
MSSAVTATVAGVPTAIVSTVALVATAAAVPTFGIAGTFPWRRKNRAPKKKDDRAGERQQHDPEVHPSGRVHFDPVRFPRLASQFGSTERME